MAIHKLIVRGITDNGTQWRNIFYYATESDFTPSSAQLTAWGDAFWGVIGGGISSTWHMTDVGYSKYMGGTPFQDPLQWGAETTYTCAHDGGAGGDVLPNQAAGVILGKTVVKRVIAKKYIGGVTEGSQNSGVPTTLYKNYLTSLAGWAFASTYSMGGTALTPGAWGPAHGFTPTLSASVSPYLGSQRRRKPGVGI